MSRKFVRTAAALVLGFVGVAWSVAPAEHLV
ncbi:MAG: hypothetical protein RJA70_480 [Pseudomonadota bacterium]|jgi:hypothetical protein